MQGQQTIDLADPKPKFHLQNPKLQVYVQHAIKKSNVKAFVNKGGQVSLNNIQDQGQKKDIAQHLFHLKNSCNGLIKDINNKENQSIKLKDQTMYTSEKVKQLQQQRQRFDQKIKKLSIDVQNVQTKKQATLYTFKTYENILWRMKKDQITNQIKINSLQKQVLGMEKQMKQLQNKVYSLKQYQQLSLKGLKQAQQQVLRTSQIRQKKMNAMSQQLQQKKINQIKRMERQNQTQSIQQMAAGDLQDSDLLRIKRFLQVQLFVKSLLKQKMQRLKNHFEPYQMAFIQIKSQASIKDANSLKTQFFNFESNYQQRTAWIKHLEEQIVKLEQQRKQLGTQYTKLKQFQLDLFQEYQENKNKTANSTGAQITINKQTFNKSSLQNQLTMMKVKEWLNFQSKRISPHNGKQQLNVIKFSSKNFSNLQNSSSNITNFNKICEYLLIKKKNQGKNDIKNQQKQDLKQQQKNQQKVQQKTQQNKHESASAQIKPMEKTVTIRQ